MFGNYIKTAFLLGSLAALLLFMGHAFGGEQGLIIALVLACAMNFFTYFYSDKLVLKMYGAQPLDAQKYPEVYNIVEELALQSRMPMPKLWLLNMDTPNAFATGRNPENASVAVTTGIMKLLDAHELRGVLAHELSHVKNRDILVGTIAATIAAAIAYLADWMRWSMIFGGRRRNNEDGGWGTIIALLLVPFMAMLIQLAISRSREYLADECGADTCHDPLALASALEKLEGSSKTKYHPDSYAQASTASLFIVYPFSTDGVWSWFSTHPPLKERIARLRKMAGIGRHENL